MVLLKDVQAALRTFRTGPLFALSIMLTMAPGIGFNTAMFSVADALILKPFPFPDLQRLALVTVKRPVKDAEPSPPTAGDYMDIREAQSFETSAAYSMEQYTLGASGTQLVIGAAVSAGFFRLLGLAPMQGSGSLGHTGDTSGPRTVMLSYTIWRDQFGSDPNVVGRKLTLNQQDYTIAGVMPRQFQFPPGVQIWTPLQLEGAAKYDRRSARVNIVGRIGPGVGPAELSARLAAIAAHASATHPETGAGWTLEATSLTDFVTGGMTGQYVLFLMGGVLVVLLMACSNVANLVFARTAARAKEVAIRAALGANRSRIMRLLVTENVVFSLLGAAASLPLANLSLHLIRTNMPPEVARWVPGFDQIALDSRALLFAAGIGIASGILAGLMPALWITRSNQLHETLKEGGRSSGSGSHQALRQWLLVGEVALAMTLLVETGLMVRSLRHLIEINPGSDPKGLLTARVELPRSKYPDAVAVNAFYSRLLSSARDSSGAETLSVATNLPDGGYGNTRPVIAEDWDPLQAREHPTARVESVSPGYFATLRIPLLNGRLLEFRDGPDAAPVGLVSSAFASRFWPGRDPIGRKVRVEGSKASVTVVGVVKDVRYNWANPASDLALYLPWPQAPDLSAFVVVRTSNPTQTTSVLRAAVARIDSAPAITGIRTWDRVIADSILGLSYVAVIMTLIGLLALALACVGLFGLMSYSVRLQLREIGIR
ncbi:MAG TPA: ADOP family duplicated permease, partial [Candidatus Binataceae bacterium]